MRPPRRALLPSLPARTDSGVEEFPCGPRGVELRLVRQMLPYAAIIGPLAIGVSFWLRGPRGAWSAAIGVALGLGNLWLSAAMMERCARVGGQALMFGVLGGFVVRLLILTVAVIGLREVPFIDLAPLLIVLVVTHIGLLGAEAVVVTADDRQRARERVLKRATERNAA